jgi:cytochrome c-type biogenesis protein CcmH
MNMRCRWILALCLSLLLASMAVLAKEAVPLGDEPWVEARMVKISEELRCLVCQNETLASSRADLAKDLREEVKSLIRQGKTDAEIKAYLVARYGDFVLYRPEVKSTTWLLWWGPFGLLFLGLGVVFLVLRARRAKPNTPLEQIELNEAAERLLNEVMKAPESK